MSSFTEKDLRLTITLGASTFGDTGKNQIVIKGMQVSVDIEKSGGQMMSTANVRVYGIALSVMEQLTMLSWTSMGVTRNSIVIEAIDGGSEFLVFMGQIINAWPDFQDAPDVFLSISSQSVFFQQIAKVAPFSFKGTVAVSMIMGRIASDLNLVFENNGVTSTITNPYLPGDTVSKARSLAKAAGIEMWIDDTTLAIAPRGQGRRGDIPVIGPESGLIGYPQFDKIGVTFRTIFNPAIRFGGLVKIESIVKPAEGVWRVTGVDHSLSSQTPGGPWFSIIKCTLSGLVPVN